MASGTNSKKELANENSVDDTDVAKPNSANVNKAMGADNVPGAEYPETHATKAKKALEKSGVKKTMEEYKEGKLRSGSGAKVTSRKQAIAIGLNERDRGVEKGKPAVPVGTKKEISGRMYIKTANGWKYFGKGGGAKAQEHHSSNKGAAKQESANDHAAPSSETNVQRGSTITAADGTVGKVLDTDGHTAKVEYTDKDGNKKTADIEHKHLEDKVKGATGESKSGDSVTAVGKPRGMDSQDKELEKTAEDEHVDINKRFDAFARFTKGVIKGRMKSMIAYGTGGVGKTFTVTKELEAAGKKPFDEEEHMAGDDDYDYIKITGKMTAPELYKAMYEHNGKILLFDDCDSVLKDSNAINLFKGALDTSGDGTIAYATDKAKKDSMGEDIPKRFKFTGRCMFISNLPPEDVPQPLKSRGYRVDLSMDAKQTMERLRHIATDKSGKYQNLKFPGVDDYTHEDLSDVLDYLDKNKNKTGDLNVRTVGTLLGIKKDAEEEGVDWKEDANHFIFSKSESADSDNPLTFAGISKARAALILNTYKTKRRDVMEGCTSDMIKSTDYIYGRTAEEPVSEEKVSKAYEDLGIGCQIENPFLPLGQQTETDMEKGKTQHAIGAIKEFGGRQYIKTVSGWKYHGKGTGVKAQEHVSGALQHHVEKKESSKPALKDATDHLIQHNDQHYIDSLDADSGEEKFKPGDKVSYTDSDNKKHEGVVSDQEGPDLGDKIYKIDRVETKEAHEKRGFDKTKGNEDVTGKEEKVAEKVKTAVKKKSSEKLQELKAELNKNGCK